MAEAHASHPSTHHSATSVVKTSLSGNEHYDHCWVGSRLSHKPETLLRCRNSAFTLHKHSYTTGQTTEAKTGLGLLAVQIAPDTSNLRSAGLQASNLVSCRTQPSNLNHEKCKLNKKGAKVYYPTKVVPGLKANKDYAAHSHE